MGFRFVDAAYRLAKSDTSPVAQAVLVALAFRCNDATRQCYPKQETLEEMTHLARSTVKKGLNELKERGFLEWDSGGYANRRGKYGQPLSNSYRIKLPESVMKEPEVAEEANGAVAGIRPQQWPSHGYSSGRHTATAEAVTRPPTEINNINETPIPNRRETESGFKRESWEDDPRPAYRALGALGIKPSDPRFVPNLKSFYKSMAQLGSSKANDVVDEMVSRIRQGEFKNVKNPAALFQSRLDSFLTVEQREEMVRLTEEGMRMMRKPQPEF